MKMPIWLRKWLSDWAFQVIASREPDFTLTEGDLRVAHVAIAGLTLGIVCFATFAFTLLLHAVAAARRD